MYLTACKTIEQFVFQYPEATFNYCCNWVSVSRLSKAMVVKVGKYKF